MAKIKLIKGLSYSGSINAKKGQIVDVEDKDLKTILKTGFFEIVEETTKETALEDMSVKELEEYAEKNAINLDDCKTKKEKLEAIINAMEVIQND